MQLTDAQLKALAHCQKVLGRSWKQILSAEWSEGYSRIQDLFHAPLQQLRNDLGPTWLIGYRPGHTQVGFLKEVERVHLYGRWGPGFTIVDEYGNVMHSAMPCRYKWEARLVARNFRMTLMEEPL